MTYTLHHGDCLDVLKTLPNNSVDSIVTDPPYGLSFMGRKWDYDVPSTDIWAECLRVLKPGGHLLAFAGTRTQHRMAVRIEDAGFEVRDMIFWCYGSGFPKSLDVSKAIDKAAGAERRVVGVKPGHEQFADRATSGHLQSDDDFGAHRFSMGADAQHRYHMLTAPATEAAKQWQGWGTALKPALEPITVARKPLIGTVAENVLAYGTGALNIDGCRVGTESTRRPINNIRVHGGADGAYVGQVGNRPCDGRMGGGDSGRWPANLIHDGSEEVLAGFPATGPAKASMRGIGLTGADEKVYGKGNPDFDTVRGHNDNGGSAARFFYCAKASNRDRDEGLDNAPQKTAGVGDERPSGSFNDRLGKTPTAPRANHHPTVKPTDLMRYLLRLVTPPNGVALDPFMGSGSTGKAAILEGFGFIGIEREAEYLAIARARIAHAATPLFT